MPAPSLGYECVCQQFFSWNSTNKTCEGMSIAERPEAYTGAGQNQCHSSKDFKHPLFVHTSQKSSFF